MRVNTAPTHLGFAATNDEDTVLIVKEGKIEAYKRAEIGDTKFGQLLAALDNQQSYESIRLLVD